MKHNVKITFCFLLMLPLLVTQGQSINPAVKPIQHKPFVLGVIDELASKELGEKRVLNIYLPEGYSESDTLRYPVVYLLDGAADEDFIHVAGLYQFNSFSWINAVPKSIVVGIATVDRRRDFTFPTTIEADKKRYPTTGKSAKFISFLEKELQPYIQQTYKTAGAKTLIGQSLGGLLATEILLKKPGLFDQYIIVSPSLWWDNGSLLEQSTALVLAGTTKKKHLYRGWQGRPDADPGSTGYGGGRKCVGRKIPPPAQ